MSYFLKNNIYLTKGAVKSCLFDFNKNKLYWLNKDTTFFVDKVLYLKEPLTKAKENTFQPFIDAGLITQNSTQQNPNPDISSILTDNAKIDFCWIALTDKCNLKCIHCYNASSPTCTNILSLEDIKYIINQIVEFGIKNIQFIGGEPLMLLPILFEVLDYCYKKFNSIEIYSNGTMFNEALLQRIKQYGNIKIAVSLYSFIEEEHDKVTGVKGSQKKTLHTIELCKQYDIPIRYAGMRMANIEIGTHDILQKDIRHDLIRLAGRANLNLYNKDLLNAKMITLNKFTKSWSKEQIINLHKRKCFSRLLYIAATMEVYPCVMERRISHGNLKQQSLKDMLKKEILNYSKQNIKECKDCEFRYMCKDCYPDSLGRNIEDKPWYCTYDVYKGEWVDKETFVEKLLATQIDTNLIIDKI